MVLTYRIHAIQIPRNKTSGVWRHKILHFIPNLTLVFIVIVGSHAHESISARTTVHSHPRLSLHGTRVTVCEGERETRK